MATYNKDTNWANEKKYLDNLSKNGTAGQKQWAESQKKELASAQAKYNTSSSSTSSSPGGGKTSQGGSSGGVINKKPGKPSSSSGGNSQYTNNTNNTNNGYTPIGDYYGDKNLLSAAAQAQIANLQQKYQEAYAAGDKDLMEAYHQQAEAIRQSANYSGGIDGSGYIPLPGQEDFDFEPAPSYSDNYSSRIDEMLNQILNRDKFDYSAIDDPLYQQYAAQYQREGDRAMQNALGEVSARTGGLASSYATTAAQQANQYYSQQLADKIPELYQLAYDMYLNDIDLQVQDLGLLQGASDTAYDRYRDTMSDWRNDRDFAYGVFRDDVADGKWQTEFDYGVSRDELADQRYDTEWQYQLQQDAAKEVSGGGGGYTGGGDIDWSGMWKEAEASGNPESWLKQKSNYQKYGLTSAPSFSDYEAWLEQQDDMGVTASSIAASLESGKLTPSAAITLLEQAAAEQDGDLSEEEFNHLLDYIERNF